MEVVQVHGVDVEDMVVVVEIGVEEIGEADTTVRGSRMWTKDGEVRLFLQIIHLMLAPQLCSLPPCRVHMCL